jgi:uncharacterized protein DUF1638
MAVMGREGPGAFTVADPRGRTAARGRTAVRRRALSPAARVSRAPDPSRVLVIGCGALARELVAVIDQAGLSNVDLTCLPATLHNRPGGIPAAVRAKIRSARPRYERIFVAYADCGTGGLLDLALADEGVERLPGAHCYEFYSGSQAFAAMSDEDPATFYLTDFLARNFDRLVIRGLGLDRHPELLPAYFGNYHRLVYLAQTHDPALVTAARRAARRLGLTFQLHRTSYGDLGTSVVAVAGAAPAPGLALPRRRVAAGARNAPPAGRGAPELGETLRDAQSLSGHGAQRAAELRASQEPRPPGTGRRRCLHSAQRRTRDLHGVQDLNPDASARAASAAMAPVSESR